MCLINADYQFQHAVFTMQMEHGQFKFFMPCNVCSKCNHRIAGTNADPRFFYSNISVVFNEYSKKFHQDGLPNLWRYS